MKPVSDRSGQTGEGPTASFEFFPPNTPKMEARLWESVARLSPLSPDFVSVTYGAGGTTRERTQATVSKIASDTHLRPAAHLTCVSASQADVMAVAEAYYQSGVRHIVALRGDPPTGMGQAFEPHPEGFANSVELIEALHARYGGPDKDFEISVAAYPEQHPDSQGWDADIAYLKAKQTAGATRFITQFFFEPEIYFAFVEKARAGGITVPILPGIMLQSNFTGLKRIAGLCQATLPAWLHELYAGTENDPETRDLITANVAAELCFKLADQGVEAFHFYTLNRAGLALSTCRLLGLKPTEVIS